VDEFKKQLHSVLDKSIQLWSVHIDALDKPLPAKDAILSHFDMVYYPEYRLSCTISGPAVPSFRISFTNLSLRMELQLQSETTEGPLPEGSLFSGSIIMNRDFIKRAWKVAGIPNGCLGRSWKVVQVSLSRGEMLRDKDDTDPIVQGRTLRR
jgi:hypothetical protein